MRTRGCSRPHSLPGRRVCTSPAGSGSQRGPARVLTAAGGPRRVSVRVVRVGEPGAWPTLDSSLKPASSRTHTSASSEGGSSARPCGPTERRHPRRVPAGSGRSPLCACASTRGRGPAQPPPGRAPPSHAQALTHAQARGGAPCARARRSGVGGASAPGPGRRVPVPRGWTASFAPSAFTAPQRGGAAKAAAPWARRSPPSRSVRCSLPSPPQGVGSFDLGRGGLWNLLTLVV